ncbi:hypothetical protein SESBI_39006 [Sesbania bispinosa]|nr:hypothetical protein SESBI_39006 [Sesbania bispinosa]
MIGMAGTATATTVRWQPLLPLPATNSNSSYGGAIGIRHRRQRQPVAVRVRVLNMKRDNNMDRVWREAWRTANDGFERFLFEAKKTAERLDRRYSLSNRLSSVARAAADRVREIDRDFEIGQRGSSIAFSIVLSEEALQIFLLSFSFSNYSILVCRCCLIFLFQTIFFIWFLLSGWLFRFLIIATWVLPFAGPLLIGTLANTLVIKGTCPACKMQFAGYKNQIIRCTSCGNIVWQPKGDFFSRDGRKTSASKSDPEIIDVDFEEK